MTGLRKEKSIVFQLSLHLLKNKYQGSYIGFLWIILEPLLILSIMYVVFSTIRAGAGPDFAVYLLSGIVIFQVFARGTQGGLASLRGNDGILKSMKIKKEIFPVAVTISSSVILMIQLGIFFIIASALSHEFTLSILLLPIPLILLFILILGLSYLFSIIFVYVRDIQPAWSIFSYALFFMSPIFWYVDEVDGLLKNIFHTNPLGMIIELVHNSVFGQVMDLQILVVATVSVLAILFFGFTVFKKVEKDLVQEL